MYCLSVYYRPTERSMFSLTSSFCNRWPQVSTSCKFICITQSSDFLWTDATTDVTTCHQIELYYLPNFSCTSFHFSSAFTNDSLNSPFLGGESTTWLVPWFLCDAQRSRHICPYVKIFHKGADTQCSLLIYLHCFYIVHIFAHMYV